MPLRALCTICTDLFDGAMGMSSIPCGHVFHTDCLVEWFEKAPVKTCPHCRRPVGRNNLICKLYLDVPEDSRPEENPYQSECDLLKRELNVKERECRSSQELITKLTGTVKEQMTAMDAFREEIAQRKRIVTTLTRQIKHYEEKSHANKHQIKKLTTKIDTLKRVDTLLKGQREEVEHIVQNAGANKSAVQQLATYCVSLKNEYDGLKNVLESCQAASEQLRKDALAAHIKEQNSSTQLIFAKGDVASLQKDLASANQEISSLKEKVDSLEKTLSMRQNDTPRRQIFGNSLQQQQNAESPGLSTSHINTPSEVKTRNGSKKMKLDTTAQTTQGDTWVKSILFQKKPPGRKLDSWSNNQSAGACYDGLGGRTKAMPSSVPLNPTVLKLKAKKAVTRPLVKPACATTLDKFLCEVPHVSGKQRVLFAHNISLSDSD